MFLYSVVEYEGDINCNSHISFTTDYTGKTYYFCYCSLLSFNYNKDKD